MEEKIRVQVKDNSPSIERILRPIVYTSWLLGAAAHPRMCSKALTIIISIINMAVCSYVLINDTIFIFSFPLIRKNFLYVFLYQNLNYLNRMMGYISSFYYIYYGIRQYNKWPELMDRLEDLDQKIRKEISINDRSIKFGEALALFMTFIFFPLGPIIHVYLYLSVSVNRNLINELLLYYILAQSLISSFTFIVVVYVLYSRFQTLNKLIGQLDKLSNVQWIAFKIRRIRKLHADICNLASMVNDNHGLYLFFYHGNCFTMTIFSVFYFFHAVVFDKWSKIIYYFFCIVYSMQFGLICWICTLACEESNRTGRIIYKIILNCQPMNLDNNEASNQSSLEMRSALEDPYSKQNSNCTSSHNPCVVDNFLRRNLDLECVTEEVNNFSIQVQQNRIVFTAFNFFEVNNALYGGLVGMIVTYLIIILQFYQPAVLEL